MLSILGMKQNADLKLQILYLYSIKMYHILVLNSKKKKTHHLYVFTVVKKFNRM